MDNTKIQSTGFQIPEEVRVFMESLLEDGGLTELEPEVKEEMLNELYARFDNYLTTIIIDTLPPEHLEAFIQMNEQKKPQPEIEQFMREHIADVQAVFAKALVDFRDLYLGNVVLSKNAPVKN